VAVLAGTGHNRPARALGAQSLFPPLFQGPCDQAVLRIDGSIATFSIFGFVPGLLQPLFPVLVQASSIPLDCLHGLATQLQGGWLQGAQDLLRHQLIDDGGLESVTGLFRPSWRYRMQS